MKIPFRALLATGCLALSAGNPSAGLLFSSWLDGAQKDVDTVKAKGVLGIRLNDAMDSAWVYAAFTNLSGPITEAHFHAGARGDSGASVMDIRPWLQGNSISAVWAPLTRQNLDSLLHGLYYVNIGTARFPNGEIRGQIEVDRDLQFIADIKGDNETVPVTTSAEGTGYFQLSPDDSILSVWVVYTKPAASEADTLTMAHLHIGDSTVNGPVAIDLTNDTAAGAAAGSINAKKALIAPSNGITSTRFLDSLKNGKVYINFHSSKYPAGLMRGQLLPREDPVFPATLHGGPGTAGRGGLAIMWLSEDNEKLMVRATYSGLSGQVTTARFMKGASTEVQFGGADLDSTLLSAEIGLDSVSSGGFHPARFIRDLINGSLSLAVNTSANPSGELLARPILPARIGSAFRLEGSQEALPAATTAFGAGVASMDRDSTGLRYMMVADSLDSTYTTAHFHKQVPGAAGPIVKDLTGEFAINADKQTGLYARGFWTVRADSAPFTKPMAAAMLADSLYVNIHTARHPAGAIRGQVAGIEGSAVSIFGRMPRLRAGHARLVPLAGGAGFRFRGEPGRTLRVRISGVTGRVFDDRRMALDAAGLSGKVEVSGLRRGMYLATWEERGVKHAARFLLQ